jgi:tRNA-Thr(GGU) m(6)t(6)A37 methyltransferase TsaA
MPSQEKIVLKPIGFVRTEAVGDEVKDKGRISQIVVNSELAEALEGIAEFSHLFVLFWLHEVTSEERKTLKVHPRGREDLPLLGVFATRTKLRPNPIGLTLVELMKVEDNVLTVRGLDAFDETPVLDLKPFDFWDMAKDVKVPRWWTKLEKEKHERLKSI